MEEAELTIRELNLVIESLETFYMKAVLRARRSRTEIRPKRVTENLGFIQTTLQHVIYIRNKRNDVTQTSDSTGDQELAGDEGKNSFST